MIPGQGTKGFPGGSVGKNLPAMQATQKSWVQSLGQKIPWRKEWLPTPQFLPGEAHGQRRLVGYSPEGCRKSDTTDATEHARTHQGAQALLSLPLLPSSFFHFCSFSAFLLHCLLSSRPWHSSLPSGSRADGGEGLGQIAGAPSLWTLPELDCGESRGWRELVGLGSWPTSLPDLEGVQQLAVMSPSPDWPAPVCPPACHLLST